MTDSNQEQQNLIAQPQPIVPHHRVWENSSAFVRILF